jgi:hypothetical protein
MGIGHTATRSASYYWSGARSIKAFGVEKVSDNQFKPNTSGLLDLIATLKIYYRIISTVSFVILVTIGGFWIWRQTAAYQDSWLMRGAYLFFCAGSFINMTGSLWPALLIGINEVRHSEQLVVAGLFIYYGVATIGLLAGFGLWALVSAMFTMYLLVRILGRVRVLSRIGQQDPENSGKFNFELLKTLWPNAWRLAGTSLGGFLSSMATHLFVLQF